MNTKDQYILQFVHSLGFFNTSVTAPMGELNAMSKVGTKIHKIIKWSKKANQKKHCITEFENAGDWLTSKLNTTKTYVINWANKIM